MNKNKLTTILLVLFSTSISHSYTEVSVLCKVNNAQTKTVSCDDGWVKMRSYSEIAVRLRDCSSSWSNQRVEIRINGTVYPTKSSSHLEVNFSKEPYLVECIDGARFRSF